MGVFATILLLVHPLLLAAGEKKWFILFSLDSPWYIWLARIVLSMMLLHTISSKFRGALRLEFQKWLRFHNILALLIIFLGFLHSWYAGGDLTVVQTQVLWMLLLSLTFFIYIYHRMLRHMRDTRADIQVVLFYANRTRKDIIFQKELREIAGGNLPRLQVIHILSRPDEKWDGETGHLSGEKIRYLCDGNQQNKAFYLCGPPIMTRQIIRDLRDLGVPDARIHFEKFSF